MHSRKASDVADKKPTLVQPAWRRTTISTIPEVKKNSLSKPATISSNSKQNVEGILKELVTKSPAKPFYDENTVFVNNTVLESPTVVKNAYFCSPAGDDGYMTANELSGIKTPAEGADPFNLSFNGYSIRKSGCWSSNSTPKFRDIPNRASASPNTQQISLKGEINNLKAENERLLVALKDRDNAIAVMMKEMEIIKQKHIQSETVMKIALDQTSQKLSEVENQRKMAWEEINVMNFLSSLQEQKIQETEERMSSNLMDCNEKIAEKSKKYKQTVKKMNQSHVEYETRANSMIVQLNEQMACLQKFAVDRIESLESEVISLRRTNENLTSEVSALKATLAEAESVSEPQNTISVLDISNEWTSPPAKFSRPNVNKRRSSAMFHGGGPGINIAMHTSRFQQVRPVIDFPAIEDEEETATECNSDGDTVVDEDEQQQCTDDEVEDTNVGAEEEEMVESTNEMFEDYGSSHYQL